MRKTFKLLLIIILVCAICSCAQKKTEPVVQDTFDESKQNENTNNQVKQDAFDEFSVLITAKAINIRNTPNATNKENIIGQVYMGETYTVFEENKDNDYTWYRIGENKWIANDGVCCIEYNKGETSDYPYVMSIEETDDLLSKLDTGGWSMSCYSESKHFYLNIFRVPTAGANIHIAADSHYKYDISNTVRVNENTYDLYVIPVANNNEISNNSTGVLRISDIGKEIVGDGNGGNIESLCFDLIMIQNNNDISSAYFNDMYDIRFHLVVSGQVAF